MKELSDLPVETYFPLIRQTLLDTYKVDSCFVRPPYEGMDRMDNGLRRMVWGSYSTNRPIFSLSKQSPYSIVILESLLGFYNMIATLNDAEEPDIICLMPFRDEPITQAGVNKIMKDNHIDASHAEEMYRFYQMLPILNIEDVIITLSHLITAFLPEFKNYHVDYVNYSSEHHEEAPSEDRYHRFSSDIVLDVKNRMEDCCNAMISGNSSRAIESMKSLIDYTGAFHTGTLVQIRHELTSLNAFLVSRMFQTPVHPSYISAQSLTFRRKIYETHSERELFHLPFEMVRKYALLAKNYTYDNYSYLVRSVINYIDQHLTQELSLSVLAEIFDKNASYLSNTFKKEVGETLTNYIGKERIQSSLRYFNTTDLSVADISALVGIADFGYFSKLFKKHVGVSPREYKKMLDKK